MKRDIQICYNDIELISNSLNSFKTALEEIKSSMKKFDGYIQMNSGKTINELIEKNSVIDDELNVCVEEVTDLYNIFSGYIDATSYYIKAVNPSAMMRVDRNDIWWNLFSVSSIKASCDNLEFLKYRQYGTTSAAFYLDEEERERENRRLRHNYNEMEEYRGKFGKTYENIQDELEELERIYKNKIIEFENADDHYAGKANALYDKYSSRGEKIWDFIEGAGKALYDFVDGVIGAVEDLVTGIVSLIGGLVYFTAADIVYLATYPFGVTPKWASDCITEVDNTLNAILKDPVLIVEGMAQEASDTVEEKGIAYGVGFVGGSVATEILLSKGLGKLKALNKADDAGDIAKNANILSGSGDDVAEAGAKTGVIEGGLMTPNYVKLSEELGKKIETDGYKIIDTEDAAQANADWADMKYNLPPVAENTKVYNVEAGDFNYARVFKEGVNNPKSPFILRADDIEGLNGAEIAEKFALPQVPDRVVYPHIPAETPLEVSIVGPQESWGTLGGNAQYAIKDVLLDDDWFTDIHPLN